MSVRRWWSNWTKFRRNRDERWQWEGKVAIVERAVELSEPGRIGKKGYSWKS